jgi:hypothetical protein
MSVISGRVDETGDGRAAVRIIVMERGHGVGRNTTEPRTLTARRLWRMAIMRKCSESTGIVMSHRSNLKGDRKRILQPIG